MTDNRDELINKGVHFNLVNAFFFYMGAAVPAVVQSDFQNILLKCAALYPISQAISSSASKSLGAMETLLGRILQSTLIGQCS